MELKFSPLKVLEQKSDMMKVIWYEGDCGLGVNTTLDGERSGVREIS